MDFKDTYSKIAEMLGLNREKDMEAANVLDGLIEESDLSQLNKLIKNKNVIVFGCGPSLKKDILNIKAKKIHQKCTLIAADGSIKALLEEDIIPQINVTDLDGDVESIISANESGTITLVHAHSDNIDLMIEIVPKLKKVIGTTQVKPLGKLHNFGGFTDGDRCVFLADHFKAGLIILAGMDFGASIGKYSGKYKKEFKLKKLEIGKKLIEEFARVSDTTVINVTSAGENIKNVPRISIKDLDVIA